MGTLNFAAQPKLHNPVRPDNGFQARDVGFAGTHSPSKSPELHKQIEVVLRGANDASSKMEHGLEMFTDKPHSKAKPYPPALNPRMVGRLEYEQMLSAYKAYKCFVASTSREIFEVAASGTAVIAAGRLIPNHAFSAIEVPSASTREESASLVRSLVQSTELRDRTVHMAQRRIWQQHTYSHRAAEVLGVVGIPAEPAVETSMTVVPKISVVVSSIRQEQTGHILGTVGKQVNVDVELVFLAHGFEPHVSSIRAEALDHGIENVVILQQPRSTSLGKCLNFAVDASSGTYVAKMDDDDVYGPHYLQDQSGALRFSGATVSGKQAHYMYLAGPGVTLLRFGHNEHKFTDFVMGPTMFTARDTLKDMPFLDLNRGEDTDFLRRVRQAGGSVYSSDRFNFLQMRSGDGDGHTWSVKEEDLMATGVVSFFGMNEEHIIF
ncbi:glycosyltransferase family protein [Paenarthrobacter sp. 2TAF44]|uniref:glycosyltransferase family protein n=1 Tax=Paenarthrobacter sp. 2TAF44 TaxID=3233018 RepID=UPI003F99FE28